MSTSAPVAHRESRKQKAGNPDTPEKARKNSQAEQVVWMLETLKLVLRLLEITNREIESKLGWSHGYLSRIFAGTISLRMEHVFKIAHHAGLSSAEFFHLAYPTVPEPQSPTADRLYKLLRRFQTSLP